jgi:hypothetical protein
MTPEGNEQLQLSFLFIGKKKNIHKTANLSTFWIKIQQEFPLLGNKNALLLLPFEITCMLDVRF